MKDYFLLPIKFLLVFLGLLFALGLLVFMGNYTSDPNTIDKFLKNPGIFVYACVNQIGLLALLGSFMILMFRILLGEQGHYLKLLFGGLLFGGLFFCIILSLQIPEGFLAAGEIGRSQSSDNSLSGEQTIFHGENNFLIRTIGSNPEHPVWIFHGYGDDAEFGVVTVHETPVGSGTVLIPEQGESMSLELPEAEPGEPLIFVQIAEWYEYFKAQLTIRRSMIDSIFLAVACTIFFCSLWIFFRLTRWPLFNFLLMVLIMSVLLPCLGFILSPEFSEQINFVPTELRRFTPEFVLCTASLFLWALNALLPSIKTWRQELLV